MSKLVNSKELAEILGYGQSTITKYKKSGILVFDNNNKIDLDKAIESIDKNVNRRVKTTSISTNDQQFENLDFLNMSLDELRKNLNRVNTQNDVKIITAKIDIMKKRIELDNTLGDYIDKNEVDIFTTEMGLKIRSMFNDLPDILVELTRNVDDDNLKKKIFKKFADSQIEDFQFHLLSASFEKMGEEVYYDDIDEEDSNEE